MALPGSMGGQSASHCLPWWPVSGIQEPWKGLRQLAASWTLGGLEPAQYRTMDRALCQCVCSSQPGAGGWRVEERSCLERVRPSNGSLLDLNPETHKQMQRNWFEVGRLW